MSGEESLAQVYREIESPKLPNLKKAGLVIFIYSLVFTSLVSFFAVMIIPDDVRQNYLENLIGGLAMNLARAVHRAADLSRIRRRGGNLILAGAVNTAIVGSNGVLNRVSEDGVLSSWFRQPHPRFGTSYRIINIVVALQIITIIISRGDVTFLANLYAFGVIWSFAMNGLAVLVLRYTSPGPARIPGAVQFSYSRRADSRRSRLDHADALPDRRRQPVHQAGRHHGGRHLFRPALTSCSRFRSTAASAAVRLTSRWTSSTWNWRRN